MTVTSAHRENRRPATTAYGRASAPLSREAARRSSARAGSAPAQTPVAARWMKSTAIARIAPGSTAAACPAALASASRRVPRGAGERQREGRERRGLAVQRDPVDARDDAQAAADEEAGEREERQAAQPHETALRLGGDAQQRAWLERGAGAAFEERGLMREDADARDDGDEQQPARRARDAPLPRERGGPVGRAGDEQHHRAADERDGRDEVDPAEGERERAHERVLF